MENFTPKSFSVTFQLRKITPVFQGLLDQILILQDEGFHLSFSVEGERWLNISCYEKSQSHPTLTVRRMLAHHPTKDEGISISALNFALSFGSKVEFEIPDSAPEFTVKALLPAKENARNRIIQNCELLGIKFL